jgi:hypothetical protein
MPPVFDLANHDRHCTTTLSAYESGNELLFLAGDEPIKAGQEVRRRRRWRLGRQGGEGRANGAEGRVTGPRRGAPAGKQGNRAERAHGRALRAAAEPLWGGVARPQVCYSYGPLRDDYAAAHYG